MTGNVYKEDNSTLKRKSKLWYIGRVLILNLLNMSNPSCVKKYYKKMFFKAF